MKDRRISFSFLVYNGVNIDTCDESGCKFSSVEGRVKGTEENLIATKRELQQRQPATIENCMNPDNPNIRRVSFFVGQCSDYTPTPES